MRTHCRGGMKLGRRLCCAAIIQVIFPRSFELNEADDGGEKPDPGQASVLKAHLQIIG